MESGCDWGSEGSDRKEGGTAGVVESGMVVI